MSSTKFVLTTNEFADKIGLPPQRVYMLRDRSNKSKNPRRPVLKEHVDYDYVEGNVMFTKEAVNTMKKWMSQQQDRKAEIKASKDAMENIKIVVEYNEKRYTVTGKTARRIAKILNA